MIKRNDAEWSAPFFYLYNFKFLTLYTEIVALVKEYVSEPSP